MDLEAVRSFVAVADTGQFQEAAAQQSLTQQAVSNRVASLEKQLGVRLFNRMPRSVTLTVDGHAFLPHARSLLTVADQAWASVRPNGRPLRVDIITSRVAPAVLLRGFHQAHPDTALDVVTLFDIDGATSALRLGTVDASIRAVSDPQRQLTEGLQSPHFELNIDALGPNFGTEYLLDVIADSPSTATLVGAQTQLA